MKLLEKNRKPSEIGPGKVLQGLLKKVSTEIETNGIQ